VPYQLPNQHSDGANFTTNVQGFHPNSSVRYIATTGFESLPFRNDSTISDTPPSELSDGDFHGLYGSRDG